MSTAPKQQFILEHLELYIIFKIPSNKALTAEINKYVVTIIIRLRNKFKVQKSISFNRIIILDDIKTQTYEMIF